MLKGHSGSKLKKQWKVVEKKSSYLVTCEDLEDRSCFLAKLSQSLPFMPKIFEIKNWIIKYKYIEGSPDFEKINLIEFGKIVKKLHSLKIDAPKKDTGIYWLKEIAETNIQNEGLHVDLDKIISELESDTEVIVHWEITDLIVNKNDEIFILDWDEAGLGSKYQDLGYVYFKCKEQRNWDSDIREFLIGYNDKEIRENRILKTAWLISIAYSRWANKDFRLKFWLYIIKWKKY